MVVATMCKVFQKLKVRLRSYSASTVRILYATLPWDPMTTRSIRKVSPPQHIHSSSQPLMSHQNLLSSIHRHSESECKESSWSRYSSLFASISLVNSGQLRITKSQWQWHHNKINQVLKLVCTCCLKCSLSKCYAFWASYLLLFPASAFSFLPSCL